MVEQERIIELDGFDLLDEPEGLPPSQIRNLRRIGLAALAVACVVALGGAARPAAPAVSHLGTISWPGGSLLDRQPPMLIAGLAIAEIEDEVLAFHPDGRQAWRVALNTDPAAGVRSTGVERWDDGIMLVRDTLRIGATGFESQGVVSIALDPATGRERWRIEGRPQRVGDLIMVRAGRAEGFPGWRIYRHLPDDLLWTVPPSRAVLTDAATDSLMTLSEEGLFTEYQMSTGKPRRSAPLTVPSLESAQEAEQVTMALLGDRLILRATRFVAPEPDTRTLAYDRATLRPVANLPIDQYLQVIECGPVICASTYDRTYVLDRDSLAELWHTERGEFLVWTGAGLLRPYDAVRVLDERTGELRIDAPGWIAVYNFGWDGLQQQTIYLIQQFGERTFVARLTPRGVRVLGSIPQVVRNCQVRADLLGCLTDDKHLGMWRLNAS